VVPRAVAPWLWDGSPVAPPDGRFRRGLGWTGRSAGDPPAEAFRLDVPVGRRGCVGVGRGAAASQAAVMWGGRWRRDAPVLAPRVSGVAERQQA
ncbi:hypothetical protein VB777_09905, partial [Synechococcus sp. CCY9202]|nr:hypothetical protein [Synechococcus sp. CCY9202]